MTLRARLTRRQPLTLRTRLILALLAMALIPTSIFTVYTLDQFNRASARWYFPRVDRAMESALQITKYSLSRLESTVLVQANDWAATWPSGARDESDGARMRASLRSAGLDFIQVYHGRDGGWALVDQVAPEGVIVAEPIDLGGEIAAALASDHVLRSSRGALAGVATLPNGDVLLAALSVPPDFFSQVEQVAEGMSHYRRQDVYVDLLRSSMVVMVVVMVAALVALAGLLANSFARETSAPVSDLSTAFERVTKGDLETRVTPRGARELCSLGSSFNDMTGQLAAQRDALQRAEREAAWRDVARKLAHEFKNILTPMQLSLQLLEDQLGGLDAERREPAGRSLKLALREVGHLGRLAEQFDRYGELPKPNFERVDLAEVVRAAAGLESEAQIEIAAPAEGATLVHGDRLLLSRAVHNLLLNACEASPAGATVEVRIARQGGEILVEILDRGSGLPKGSEQRLFEPYVSTKKRGSGLGLSLVRDITRQHGGEITLENRPDGGALARLRLPLAEGDGRQAAEKDRRGG